MPQQPIMKNNANKLQYVSSLKHNVVLRLLQMFRLTLTLLFQGLSRTDAFSALLGVPQF
jgi:hypothetical protein